MYFKPLLDLPALSPTQQIGEFEHLVLVQKKNWKTIVEQSKSKKLKFVSEISLFDGINEANLKEKGKRLIYVIVECIPIPIMI